ncbi:hypothetical protein [Lentzea atacamensis]|nr:hypothetical protein [Lentzea atacamensis]
MRTADTGTGCDWLDVPDVVGALKAGNVLAEGALRVASTTA